MGNYGFANIMIENQGIFAVLILLLIYLPIIIECKKKQEEK